MVIIMKKILSIFALLFATPALRSDVHYFKDLEYKNAMEVIKNSNELVYDALKECSEINGKPCLTESKDVYSSEGVKSPTQKTNGYPLLAFKPKTITDRSMTFYNFLSYYESVLADSRKPLLETLKSIAPKLHAELVKVDPSGFYHSKMRYDKTVEVQISKKDGLPLFIVDFDYWMNCSARNWILGHELGHYVLGHVQMIEERNKEGKKLADAVLSKYPNKEKMDIVLFANTFNNAYIQTFEYEADRFAIVNLGITLDDINLTSLEEYSLRENQKFNEKNPQSRATFKQTHPLWEKRITLIKELSRAVEKHEKPYDKKPIPIDWISLAKAYKDNEGINKR